MPVVELTPAWLKDDLQKGRFEFGRVALLDSLSNHHIALRMMACGCQNAFQTGLSAFGMIISRFNHAVSAADLLNGMDILIRMADLVVSSDEGTSFNTRPDLIVDPRVSLLHAIGEPG